MIKWFLAVVCTGIIFTTIPLARGLQKLVYDTVGKEFFTYFVLFTVLAGLIVLLYILIIKLQVRKPSQYLWIILCSGTLIYFTFQLRKHPEEAIHLLEYGVLACLLLNALGHRIKDWTAYITAGLLVVFIGTVDECVQWVLPSRVWDYKDVGINALAGVLSLLAINRGMRPASLQGKVTPYSVHWLAAAATVIIILLGLCLSNTPRAVSLYTEEFPALSWLRSEEPMTEYGYKHREPEIGTFYSRFTKEELRKLDSRYGEELGKVISAGWDDEDIQSLTEQYTPVTTPFLHEFLVHVLRMKKHYTGFIDDRDTESARTALFEQRILKKYFPETLISSGLAVDDSALVNLEKTVALNQGEYLSQAGKLITAFNLKDIWIMLVVALVMVWAGRSVALRRLRSISKPQPIE
ncbi:MAG: VanZ family protein [Nitrospiraceae bacterium]|nr:MAG: VanZ family protein [Nitrospiraceae bacterium]